MRIVSTSRPHSWNMKASPLNVSLFAGCATVLGACLTAATLTRGAQDSPPRWMNEVTLLDPGEHHAIPPCELAYHVSWNGLIKAGEATLKLGLRDPKVPENLLGTCESRSAGLASRLWSYKNVFRSKVDSASLRPIFFEARETEKRNASSPKPALPKALSRAPRPSLSATTEKPRPRNGSSPTITPTISSPRCSIFAAIP